MSLIDYGSFWTFFACDLLTKKALIFSFGCLTLKCILMFKLRKVTYSEIKLGTYSKILLSILQST